jgi:hypothetical protein
MHLSHHPVVQTVGVGHPDEITELFELIQQGYLHFLHLLYPVLCIFVFLPCPWSPHRYIHQLNFLCCHSNPLSSRITTVVSCHQSFLHGVLAEWITCVVEMSPFFAKNRVLHVIYYATYLL